MRNGFMKNSYLCDTAELRDKNTERNNKGSNFKSLVFHLVWFQVRSPLFLSIYRKSNRRTVLKMWEVITREHTANTESLHERSEASFPDGQLRTGTPLKVSVQENGSKCLFATMRTNLAKSQSQRNVQIIIKEKVTLHAPAQMWKAGIPNNERDITGHTSTNTCLMPHMSLQHQTLRNSLKNNLAHVTISGNSHI